MTELRTRALAQQLDWCFFQERHPIQAADLAFSPDSVEVVWFGPHGHMGICRRE